MNSDTGEKAYYHLVLSDILPSLEEYLHNAELEIRYAVAKTRAMGCTRVTQPLNARDAERYRCYNSDLI